MPDFINDIKQTQQQILQRYSNMLKPGGTLVYATCSILPSENREQVNAFLASEAGTDFQLVSDKAIFTHQTGQDGFYMAKLKRE